MGNSPCWIWEGAYNNKGYPRLTLGGEHWLAHRLAYERYWGPIPGGMQLDHICREPGCINPLHLEPVTCRENLRRSPFTQASIHGNKRVCLRGHPFDATLEQGYRWCRVCANRRKREGRARKALQRAGARGSTSL